MNETEKPFKDGLGYPSNPLNPSNLPNPLNPSNPPNPPSPSNPPNLLNPSNPSSPSSPSHPPNPCLQSPNLRLGRKCRVT